VLDPTIQVEWVLDAEPHAGPIEALLEAFEDPLCESETLQLAPVDVPWISSEVFAGLEATLEEGDALAMPSDGLWAHPLLALVRPDRVVNALRGNDRRPLHIQFTEMPHSLMLEEPLVLRNVNTPEDLE